MSKVGAELGPLQQLADRFRIESDQVQQLTNTINSQVHATYWEGRAADAFRNQWESEFRPVLNRLHLALDGASTHIRGKHGQLEIADRVTQS
jgi:WXG100 family type VII secretion target